MENTFHAGIVTLLKYPGLFDLEYGKRYKLMIDGKKAAVMLNTTKKGIKIIDNKNSINLENHKEPLNRSLLEKSEEAHIVKMEPRFEDKDLEDRDIDPLHIMISQIKDKEIFISENYYSTLLIFVEYEQFNLDIFEDTKKVRDILKGL